MPSRLLRSVLLVAVACATVLRAQSIVTFAGGGTLDGQRATDIPTSGPRGVALDRAGNVYIVASAGEQVLRVDAATGIVSTVAGNGAAGFTGDGGLAVNAALRQPSTVVLDSDGNLYIADTGNNRVRRVDAKSGFISTYAGEGTPPQGTIGDGGPATAAWVGRPFGLTIFGGALYITEQDYNANRVRRVDMATGKISTVAGSTDSSALGGFGGDGGPAKDALLDTPLGIAADAAGNLDFVDAGNQSVRRIDTGGTINTIAKLDLATVVAFDRDGNLLVAAAPGVHKIDKNTQAVTAILDSTGLIYGMAVDARGKIYFSDQAYGKVFTFTPGDAEQVAFAGGGAYVGDGRRASAGILHNPQGLVFDAAGNLIIIDRDGNLVRKVSAADGTLSTIAGTIGGAYVNDDQEGTDAKNAVVGFPVDVDIDSSGNLYVADLLNLRIWRINTEGKIATYAGGSEPADGFGDGGPATAARIVPQGISLDRAGNLYIADSDPFSTPPHARIRKVDAQTKTITTIAGGAVGYAGDGGPATQAHLDGPADMVVDSAGNLYIADTNNGAIRRVDPAGTITTYAGHKQDGEPVGDGGAASGARLTPLHLFLNRANDDLYVADFSNHRVRKIDRNGIITTVAGSAQAYWEGGYGGDNGPATDAKLNFDYGDFSGIALGANGSLYIADSGNNRVRVVSACRTVAAPSLTAPANGATGAPTAPRLAWGTVDGAFRYDVLLDTANPPVRTVAADIDETQFTPANLLPGVTYYWAVVAKSDRFCLTVARSTSSVASFTTAAGCGAGAFDVTAPAEGAQNVNGAAVHLAWQPSAGAASYDVYLGTTNPPPLVTTTSQTFFDTAARGASFWFVVAHAACDATETASTPVHTFTATAGNCGAVPTVAVASPASGATNVATTVDLTWTVSGGDVESIDVYFGTASTPPLLRAGLAADARALSLPVLAAGTTYFWRVVAKSSCFPAGAISTPVAMFTTRTCAAPGPASIVFAPATVDAGSTYAIVWTPAPGLDAEGAYMVERSTSPSFATTDDAQVVGSTAASFIAGSTGTLYHRVRPLPSCDPTNPGPPSDVRAVSIVSAPPNVIFTVQPQAVITALGERLEDKRGSFAIENIGSSPVAVIVARQELGGSKPFFSVAGDAAFITLEPHKPRTFAITYSGPPTDVPGSYQGVIVVSALGQGLAVTPYAFVNLKVGGGVSATPQFESDGAPADYAAFAGVSGDDSGRAPLEVTLRNPGTTPMELGAEIGPEVWLSPEPGWNSTPLAGGASRTIRFVTQRTLAPNGPLPRYTYFTVRTRDGASARLLVQDNDKLAVAAGRSSALNPAARSFIVPQAVSETASGGARLVSRIRLSNVGGDSVQAELIFTPSGSDGFDGAAVKRAIVVVPPNDIVTLTDPLAQIFGLPRPTAGQMEIRLPRERTGLINVRAGIVAIGAAGGFDTPVVARGDGATAGALHVINLLASSNVTLTLAETSGRDAATAHVTLFDASGVQTSTFMQVLPRYGMARIRLQDSAATRVEIRVDDGGGAVIGLATIAAANGAGGATVLSTPLADSSSAASTLLRALWKPSPDNGTVSVTTVVPVLPAPSSAGAAPAYHTALGLVAAIGTSGTFNLSFREPSGGSATATRTVSVPAGSSKIYADVLSELFGFPAGKSGSVVVQPPPGGKVYAVVQSATTSSYLALPTNMSEALTSAGSSARRPLFYDGLEQSTDPTRGTRWMLALNETSGAAGSVNVRLYEAANRSSSIASLDVPIAAYQQVTLDTVFSALGLDAADRRKERTNVQVVVTALSGTARVAAFAVSIDNQSGDTKTFALTPVVGSGAPNIAFTAPLPTTQPPPPSQRRRAVGH